MLNFMIMVISVIWSSNQVVVGAARAPTILQNNRGVEIPKGHRLQEVCAVSAGDLPLTFLWLKNGQTMSTNVDATIRRIDDYSSHLIIESVSEYSSGNYSCVVSNPAGKDQHTITLQVNVQPYWIRQPTDASVLAGDDVTLLCQAGGSPAVKTSWKKSKNILTEMSNDVRTSSKLRVDDDGSLSIAKATEEEEGFYTCVISNGVGDGLRKTVKVEVLVPPRATEEFRVMSLKKGSSVELYCNVTGDLPLRVTWEKDTGELKMSSDDRMSITQTDFGRSVASVMKIDSSTIGDSGTYTCSGQNGHGRSDTRFRLTIIEPPGKIKKVTLLNIWSRSVRLSWDVSYNGNSPITNILIEHEAALEDSGGKVRQMVKPNEPSNVLEDLAPGTTYYLWVRAENEVGIGDPSDRVVLTTTEEEPSHAPGSFKVDSVRARSARFSWESMRAHHWNGKPLGYYLGYVETRSDGHYAYKTIWDRHLPNGTVKSYLLSGLRRSTDYKIALRAFNAAGIGPLTDAVKIRTKTGVPPNTPVIKVLSSKSGDVEFNIYQESQDDEVESYICHIKRQPNSNWEEAPLVVTPRSRYTIGCLQGSSKYQAFVTAKNAFGASEPSEVVAFNTDPADPFAFGKVESESLLEKTWTFVLPTAVSLVVIIISFIICCCVLCNCTNQKRVPRKQDGVAVRDFSYCAPASCSRSESGYYPPLRTSLPRGSAGSQSGLMSANRSVYNEPRNYSPSTEDSEEPKYECVMEEMKTFLQPQVKTGSGSSKRSSKQSAVPAVPT